MHEQMLSDAELKVNRAALSFVQGSHSKVIKTSYDIDGSQPCCININIAEHPETSRMSVSVTCCTCFLQVGNCW